MAKETLPKLNKMKREKPEAEESGDDPEKLPSFWDDELVRVVDSTLKNRKTRRKPEQAETMQEIDRPQLQLQDPLMFLGFDIMHMILGFLDARSGALSLLVSRGWNGVASSDRLWSIKCEELWLGKAHMPRISKIRGLSKLEVYSRSTMDGKRTRIMRDDLCDHDWEFHFTKTAPVYWRDLDPYWNGTGQIMRRYFHQDGSQTADPGDAVWGGHEACYSVVTGMETSGKIREHYVRINRSAPMSISRNLDWSWEMNNNFCSYSSIPNPDRIDGTGPP